MPTGQANLIGSPCNLGEDFVRSVRPQPDAVRDERVLRLLMALKVSGVDIHRIAQEIPK